MHSENSTSGHRSNPIPPRALFLLIILTLVWGTNWPLFSLAVKEVSVWTFRSFSCVTAGLLLLAYVKIRGQSIRIERRHWPVVLVSCFLYMVIWNITSTYSAVLLPSGQASVLGFTMPLWAALFSWLFYGEPLRGRMLLALAFGASGVALLMVPSFRDYANAPLGFVLGLTGGAGWALGTIILKRGAVAVPASVLTGWQLLITAVPCSIGAAWFGDWQWFIPSTTSLIVIAYITIVPILVGNVCWIAIVGLLPTQVAGLSAIAVPMVAMISGAFIHAEPLGLTQWLAMGCTAIALGLLLVRGSGASR
ncbi:MAG: putative inner rane transporter yiJE [Pseudomonadota bacterium]|jgi:drug/metabolite transporter (DMT)-like permease|nr:DMT family transporter [Pseudomonadota bacterium]